MKNARPSQSDRVDELTYCTAFTSESNSDGCQRVLWQLQLLRRSQFFHPVYAVRRGVYCGSRARMKQNLSHLASAAKAGRVQQRSPLHTTE